MTDRQKLKSIERKMKRIQNNNPDFDLEKLRQVYPDLERYMKLSQEHFFFKFNIEHCEKCGKKL